MHMYPCLFCQVPANNLILKTPIGNQQFFWKRDVKFKFTRYTYKEDNSAVSIFLTSQQE